MSVVVFDIDGVLADHRHRIHYIAEAPKDWEAYYDGMVSDPTHDYLVDCLKSHAAEGCVILATGRPEKYRNRTCDWLERVGIYYSVSDLLMRADGDFRPNPEVKEQHALQIIMDYSVIHMAYEDDPRSVAVWKKYARTVAEISHSGEWTKVNTSWGNV